MDEMNEQELLKQFHVFWDEFPGPVRLIDKNHRVIASNGIAEKKGFIAGVCCAAVGEPCSHRGCKASLMLKSGKAQTDRPANDRIRGWVPLQGYPNVYVHYTLTLPEDTL